MKKYWLLEVLVVGGGLRNQDTILDSIEAIDLSGNER